MKRVSQGERQNSLTLHIQPLVLSSRLLLAAYRRAPAGSSCAKPAKSQGTNPIKEPVDAVRES
jgi:hypothetical protein